MGSEMCIRDRFEAIIEDIVDCRERGQPALVGTTSIETSELLSSILNEKGIKHEVLNAKQHEREALIVQQAGRPGAITIATNMAGRGTDIVLGGNLEAELSEAGDKAAVKSDWQERHDQVLAAGGLHIVGTERHDQSTSLTATRCATLWSIPRTSGVSGFSTVWPRRRNPSDRTVWT